MTNTAWKPKARVLASFGNEVKEKESLYRDVFKDDFRCEEFVDIMVEDDLDEARVIANEAIEKMLRSGRN